MGGTWIFDNLDGVLSNFDSRKPMVSTGHGDGLFLCQKCGSKCLVGPKFSLKNKLFCQGAFDNRTEASGNNRRTIFLYCLVRENLWTCEELPFGHHQAIQDTCCKAWNLLSAGIRKLTWCWALTFMWCLGAKNWWHGTLLLGIMATTTRTGGFGSKNKPCVKNWAPHTGSIKWDQNFQRWLQ